MVVDNVQQDHDSMIVSALNEPLEFLGAAVGTIGREREDAVVSPIAPSREVGYRHEFDSGDSQISQIIEASAHRRKLPGRGESSDVQFVNDGLIPWTAAPLIILPIEGFRIDNLAGTVHVLWLKP